MAQFDAVEEPSTPSFLPWSMIPESEYVPYPQLKALRVSNAEMFIHFFVGCLAALANRPLIASFLDEARALAKP